MLESICLFDDTDIVVYTSTPFMNRIKQSHLFHEKIKFELNDTYHTIDSSCKARLDVFDLHSIQQYEKILYLDTDIIIKNSTHKIFDICQKEVVYVLEEGHIDSTDEYWGNILFGEEVHQYNDKTAFTSGILLFKHCQPIKELFETIKKDIINRPYQFGCYDQPYIVYNAFKYNIYDNKVLKSFVINQDTTIDNDIIIHHFPGVPGWPPRKIDTMTHFLNEIKERYIQQAIDKTKTYINEHLFPIIHASGELLEGNIFTLHHRTEYTDVYLNKTKNISNLVLNKNIKNVLEVGFNSGFSALLMLLTNPYLYITCIDLGDHTYTLPCYQKIKETFGERIHIILGDSTKTLSSIQGEYDLIHIDGGHSTFIATSDIVHSYRLSKRTILIMDDYDFPHLYELWNHCIKNYDLKPLNINLYDTPHHDIKFCLK
jgi:predicted O-methyltransferase YrrM